MIGLPPLPAGAVHVTVAEVLPGVAATAVGAPATAAGMIAVLVADGALVPAAFVAVTVKVYAVPLVRPVTVQLVAVVQLLVPPPGRR